MFLVSWDALCCELVLWDKHERPTGGGDSPLIEESHPHGLYIKKEIGVPIQCHRREQGTRVLECDFPSSSQEYFDSALLGNQCFLALTPAESVFSSSHQRPKLPQHLPPLTLFIMYEPPSNTRVFVPTPGNFSEPSLAANSETCCINKISTYSFFSTLNSELLLFLSSPEMPPQLWFSISSEDAECVRMSCKNCGEHQGRVFSKCKNDRNRKLGFESHHVTRRWIKYDSGVWV